MTSGLGLAIGGTDDAAAEVTAGAAALEVGAEIGEDNEFDRFDGDDGAKDDDNVDDDNAPCEATDAASCWVHAVAAASTAAAVKAPPIPRRPRPWLATSRG